MGERVIKARLVLDCAPLSVRLLDYHTQRIKKMPQPMPEFDLKNHIRLVSGLVLSKKKIRVNLIC